MGNREKLLDAAEQCIYAKGYARTTARDVASAAGVSLAAIGYHFGSTEALLSAALHRALEAWGEQFAGALAAPLDEASPGVRLAAIWNRIITSLHENPALWSTQFEIVGLMDRVPAFREAFAGSQERAWGELAAVFQGVD